MIVLVADDLDVNRKLLRTLLVAEGYDVLEASNGTDAFQILQGATGPIVGLIDWEMPEMEGIEVCRQARALESPRRFTSSSSPSATASRTSSPAFRAAPTITSPSRSIKPNFSRG